MPRVFHIFTGILFLATTEGYGVPLAATAAGLEPQAAIARLNYAGYQTRYHCTAVLVDANRALTAAHCLQGIAPEDLHVLRGYDRGAWLEHLRPTGVSAVDSAADIATLCFETGAGRPFLPVAPRPPQVGETVVVYGYGYPRVHAVGRTSCQVLRRHGPQDFLLDCPLSSGWSGGPVLRERESGYEVLGIVSAGSEGATRVAEAGSAEGCGSD